MNNSINNPAARSKLELKTYFVETHEWDIDTGKLSLMEYFEYDSGVQGRLDYSGIESIAHHTILSLAVF